MATESKANKNATATCIVQVVRLISLKLLKLATHETLNTDWALHSCQGQLCKVNLNPPNSTIECRQVKQNELKMTKKPQMIRKKIKENVAYRLRKRADIYLSFCCSLVSLKEYSIY